MDAGKDVWLVIFSPVFFLYNVVVVFFRLLSVERDTDRSRSVFRLHVGRFSFAHIHIRRDSHSHVYTDRMFQPPPSGNRQITKTNEDEDYVDY